MSPPTGATQTVPARRLRQSFQIKRERTRFDDNHVTWRGDSLGRMYAEGMNEKRNKSNEKHLVAPSDGSQALQTDGHSPKQVDVLRLPNRDLTGLRIQRCMFKEKPHLMAIPCRFEIEWSLSTLRKVSVPTSTPTDNNQVTEILPSI